MIMKLKKGDNVMVITGKNKGKNGKITQSFPAKQRVVVEGVNSATKHLKSGRGNEKGQKLEFSAPVDVSNVMLVCPKCSKPTRIEIKVTAGATGRSYIRTCKKCKENIN